VADYVLISYGTGAIMAVPAHDTRDFEFAKQFDLPIVAVVDPGRKAPSPLPSGEGPGVRAAPAARYQFVPLLAEERTALRLFAALRRGRSLIVRDGTATAFLANGTAINSGPYNGLPTAEFKRKIAEDLAAWGIGRSAVNYKLRDWLFSRQHFWGEPFPILHELDAAGKPNGRIQALRPEELPLDLPEKMKFDAKHDEPTPPLDKAPHDWLYVTLDGRCYKRETNTMPQWAGSCWYYLRFLDPKNPQALVDPEIERAWMPVDLYVGGAEHAVLHLLYARFWHKVLFDRGYVTTPEPFQKLVNQGMILGENGEKMSKSRGNVVNPDEVVRQYGADALRLYEMFMGPLEAVKPWSMDGVSGVRGFLDRVWRMILDDRAETVVLDAAVQDVAPTAEQNRVLHKTIKAVTDDLKQMSFNTAIARMMEFTNFFLKAEVRPREAMEKLVLLLSPFAPHIAEELWQALGHADTLAYQRWPTFDAAAIDEETAEAATPIDGEPNGKARSSAGHEEQRLYKMDGHTGLDGF
jgi:leucyl-tRNA synthetase